MTPTLSPHVEAPEGGRVPALPSFNLNPWPEFDLPAHADKPELYSLLRTAFLDAAARMEQAHGRPGFEDVIPAVAPRIFRAVRHVLVGQHPDYLTARAALKAVGSDERTEAYAKARIAFDEVLETLDAAVVKQLDKWVSDVRTKLKEDHKAVVARRAEKAAAARATLSEVVPTIRAAVELIEAERERFSGAMRSLAKVHPAVGRFNLLDGARAFNEAVDLLRRSLPPDAFKSISAEPVKRGPGRPRTQHARAASETETQGATAL